MEPGSCGLSRRESEQEILLPRAVAWSGVEERRTHCSMALAQNTLILCWQESLVSSVTQKGAKERCWKPGTSGSPIIVRLGACIFLSSLAKNVHTLRLPFPPTPTCSETFSVRHNRTFMDAVTCTP